MPTTLTSDTRPAKASEAAAGTAAPALQHDPSRLRQPGFAVRAKWFWYSVASCACWTGWALTARLGSSSIPAPTMEVVSTFGFVLVTLAVVLASARRPAERDLLGSGYALVSGILLGLGGVALYQAYRVGRNASVVTATSSLYPIVTVVCAMIFLRERLSRLQFCGLVFAMAAIVTLSL
jgi:transporter family protein